MNCQVKELSVQARLKDQVAQVQVSQTFLNTGSTQLEAQFVYPLPYDGAIDRLTLMVDGKEFPAQLLSKEEARGRYEAIVRSSKDPALLEWMGQGCSRPVSSRSRRDRLVRSRCTTTSCCARTAELPIFCSRWSCEVHDETTGEARPAGLHRLDHFDPQRL